MILSLIETEQDEAVGSPSSTDVSDTIEGATRFFSALARGDMATIEACYASDVVLYSPIMGEVRRDAIIEAYRVFLQESESIDLTFSIATATPDTAIVAWQAAYTFFPTGRIIRHFGRTTLIFVADQIHRQIDRFDLRKWTPQAIGPAGHALIFVPGMRAWIGKEVRAAIRNWRGDQ